MPFEVRMPQLGMAQESGVIVAWLKARGDSIQSGEVLFEVETDKSTMEVEAAADGFVGELRADEGDDVPVGEVIAVIVDTAAEVRDAPRPPPDVADVSPSDEQEAESARPDPGASVETPGPSPILPAAPAGPIPSGGRKVLASPKAKRQAAELGIDLTQLRAQGVSEPIHSADLTHARPGGLSAMVARADGTMFRALLGRAGETGDRTDLFAAFVVGAWRTRFDVPGVAVTIRALDGTETPVPDPVRAAAGDTPVVALNLVDLCGTRVSGYSPATGGATLSIAEIGEDYRLTLSFAEADLSMVHAVALLDEIAARVEDPIRQLL